MEIVNVLKRNYKSIGKIWLKYMGGLASLCSVFLLFYTWSDIGITTIKQKAILVGGNCIVLLFVAMIWVCKIKKTKIIWENASGKIKVCYSDIIKESFILKNKEEKLFVIPVNSCFDTIVDEDIAACSKPLVSPNSLHGRWIKAMLQSGFSIRDIDGRIQEYFSLQELNSNRVLLKEEKERGKREVYDLGTVAMVRGKQNCTFLLLALTEFDKNNVAHCSVDDLVISIKSLIEFYNQHGQGHKLLIPLMGTNFSRTGLSHNDSLRIITSLFQVYGNKIRGEVEVVVYVGDKDKVSIDF